MKPAVMKPAVKSASTLLAAGLATLIAGSSALSADTSNSNAMLGFSAEHAIAERALEQHFDSQLNAAELRAWLQRFSSEANHVGSPHNKANAEYIQQLLQSWGWDTHIETFDVLYPTLKRHQLEMISPTHFVAKLREPPVAGDITSSRTDGVPLFNAYGGDGDVTAELVYVNFGMPDDYQELARLGIDVRGKIAIARYGGGWRGLKPKLAYEHGAVGCIIYSDPHEDGYFQGNTYPKGGWRPADGGQRGSVMDMPLYPGDPLTPGIGATKNAKRLAIADAKTILKIPVLPISYSDAEPLLAALTGPVAPMSWRGALPMTYHVGAGPAKVHLSVFSNWDLHPAYDVIAKIPGAEAPDEWVIRGNHRDAWVFGASDPLSGEVDMLAEAKAIGAQLKSGWRPKRTLIYASWDAEEPGLIGSTEWAEQHEEELKHKAVLYLNSDSNGRGFLSAGGSHSWQRLVNEVAESVIDPETHVTVHARLQARLLVHGYEKGASEAQKEIAKQALSDNLPIAALGSGSDFSPFLQHLGLASLSIEYGGEDEANGSYHSNYDSFYNYSHYGDPTFEYGVAEAQTVGHIVLRIADADVLPMQFSDFSHTVAGYVHELHKLADSKRSNASELNKLLDEKAFALAADPTHPILPPAREPQVPYLDFAPLDNAMTQLTTCTKTYDAAYAKLGLNFSLTESQRTQLDALLRGQEQTLTGDEGLPGRPWYKHLIYAPGMLTGYGVKTLPGVREAIEDNRWEQANQYVVITAKALDNYCARLDRATALLKQ